MRLVNEAVIVTWSMNAAIMNDLARHSPNLFGEFYSTLHQIAEAHKRTLLVTCISNFMVHKSESKLRDRKNNFATPRVRKNDGLQNSMRKEAEMYMAAVLRAKRNYLFTLCDGWEMDTKISLIDELLTLSSTMTKIWQKEEAKTIPRIQFISHQNSRNTKFHNLKESFNIIGKVSGKKYDKKFDGRLIFAVGIDNRIKRKELKNENLNQQHSKVSKIYNQTETNDEQKSYINRYLKRYRRSSINQPPKIGQSYQVKIKN